MRALATDTIKSHLDLTRNSGNLPPFAPSNSCASKMRAIGATGGLNMFVRLGAALAAVSLLGSAVLAQGAKPTDPQIAHIAYTAGVIDIAAAKALAKPATRTSRPLRKTWCATMKP